MTRKPRLKMRTLQNLLLTLLLLLGMSGCGTTRVVVVESNADWVKLGPDVSGHVYLWNHAAEAWSLSDKKVTLPEGWMAGPAK